MKVKGEQLWGGGNTHQIFHQLDVLCPGDRIVFPLQSLVCLPITSKGSARLVSMWTCRPDVEILGVDTMYIVAPHPVRLHI